MASERERAERLAALQRLLRNPDFYVLREWIAAKISAQEALNRRILATPEMVAEHNFSLGVIAGLEALLDVESVTESQQTARIARERNGYGQTAEQ